MIFRQTLGTNLYKFNNFHNFHKYLNYNTKENDILADHFLLNLIHYTLPHILIEKRYNSHLLVDKLNKKVNYSHLFYNLHLDEDVIQQNNILLMRKENILRKQFYNYNVNCFTVGSGFYSKQNIPYHIKTLHRERYDKLLGVNEYLENIGCNVKFPDNKIYKTCFKSNKPYIQLDERKD